MQRKKTRAAEMERLIKVVFLAVCHGLIGAVLGMVAGVGVGIIVGLILGGMGQLVALGAWLGIFLGGITFAWTAAIWDYDPSTEGDGR